MTKKILFFSLFLSLLFSGYGQQFNPDVARKTLVKIMVTSNGKAGTCSGFIWKKGNWVVTSLHAMRPGGTISVQYPDGNWKKAKIKTINVKADLVLLELLPGETVSGNVVPLTGFSAKQLLFDEPIYAVGYNSGSEGSPTRSMKKGDLKPKETLEYLVPPADLTKVKQGGIPHYQLDIIYIDGSLLPGYSGSPVYDKTGALVGIGDGGLEGGASNVSWVIPAKYLTDLENSTVTALPDGFEKTVLHFSAEHSVDVSTENPEAIEQIFADEYQSYDGGGFVFYYTKTRSIYDMYLTSYDPGNIDKIVDEFETYNLHIDYNVLGFDIYEDAVNGIVVAIPENQPFTYDEETNLFSMDMSNFPQGYYFSLRFEGVQEEMGNQNIEETADILINNINANLGGGVVGGFSIDQNYSYSRYIDENHSIAYILLSGNNQFVNADGITVAYYLYITLLQDDKRAFYSIADIVIPIDVLTYAATYGIDCENNYDASPDYCDYFESYMQIMVASHLTTFANKQVYSER